MSEDELVDGRWPVVVDAEAAYEAIRSINHRTIWLSDGLPAPAVYWVLAELKAALYGQPRQPQVFDFIVGLGGRDITPTTLHGIADYVLTHEAPPEHAIWWEVMS